MTKLQTTILPGIRNSSDSNMYNCGGTWFWGSALKYMQFKVVEGVSDVMVRPNDTKGHTETGLKFKDSSERMEKPGIEHTIPGLHDEKIFQYNTDDSGSRS